MKKKVYIFLYLLIAVSFNVYSQKIIRQSISCLGASNSANRYLIQQTIGQSSNTKVFYNENNCLRQGFLQPVKIADITGSFANNINLTVFPNPANDNFIIRISGSDSTFILKVTIVPGKIMFTSEINNTNEQIINSSGWSKGVYLISIYYGNQLGAFKKIIKN